ncbi:MAG: FKBP-type peptidyl-prolyl cis-trans isomerase [Gammaproteobacteria bacterium]|nr:FKBP-type peptidyl-prolyl cis-trans isomerase [Gammaproteobacteria bacterium]
MALSVSIAQADEDGLSNEKQKFSYAVGVQIGQDLKRNGMDIDANSVAMAVDDVMADNELKLTMEEMQTLFADFQKKETAKKELASSVNKAEGEAFLAENKEKEGIVVLESGLQYKVITAGTGKQPTAEDTVSVHYRGTLINGTEFDSSYQRGEPATFPVNGVISGWTEALQLMKEGAKWQLFIPSDLAYGPRGASADIGPHTMLQFDIELLSVK